MKKETSLHIDKSTWKLTKLGELASDISIRVDNPAQSKYDRFVGLEDFVPGDLKITKWSTTENLTSSAKAFQKGDILFARRNAYLRRASLVEFDGCCSGDAFVLREKRDKVAPGFLAFLMNSNALWDFANSNAAGTMSKRVKWRDLEAYEFLLPPKDQQSKLAELLWAMDAVVEKEVRIKNQLQYTFNIWVNTEISIKKGWVRKPLSSVAHVQTGVAKNSAIANDNQVIEVPYIRVANVQDGFLDLSEIKTILIRKQDKERFSLLDGDLLLTEGGDFDKLGRGYIWKNAIPDCVHQNHVFAIRPDPKILSSMFLSLVTRSNYGKQYFLACAKKTSNLASINSSQLKEFRVFIPKLEEQTKLVSQFFAVEDSMRQHTAQIAASKSLQKSLLNQIF